MTTAMLRAGDIVRGERGGEYRVLEWRGEGSYARVYRAESRPERGGPVLCAVKLAKPEISGAVEKLERERAVRTRVRHPRLAEPRDAGRWEDAPFLVLTWIEGPDLRRLVERQRRLPLVAALGYLEDVAGAVAALHAAGLAHGDLRPENVLVEEVGRRAVLTDLGGAAERHDPHQAALLRGDACALGQLLAFMLTGERAELFPQRFTRANGYNPAAIRLWQEASAGRLIAAALHRESAALLKAIGAPRRG